MDNTKKGFLGFLYLNPFGRVLLKILTMRWISIICGWFLSTRLSKIFIRSFIKRNDINLNDYENVKYNSFNDCFTRKIKPSSRPIGEGLISPADGFLSAYEITDNSEFKIKGSIYSVKSLLGGTEGYKDFYGGTAVVIRLCVDNYHRYHYIDNGKKGDNRFVKGALHTVRPIALMSLPVFTENCREYTFLQTESFGKVAQIEVGAMLVGKIKNHHREYEFKKGEEKGMFLFGGSTVVLLFQKDKIKLLDKFKGEEETPVKFGETIGNKKP